MVTKELWSWSDKVERSGACGSGAIHGNLCRKVTEIVSSVAELRRCVSPHADGADGERGFCAARPNIAGLSVNAELFDPIAELPEGQAKQLCRCRLVVARLLEGIDDRLALHVLDVVAKIGAGRQRRFCGIL